MDFPHIVTKGWGFERWFANDEENNYCGKELVVIGGKQCSLHYHPIKHETFYVMRGKIILEYSHNTDLEPDRDGKPLTHLTADAAAARLGRKVLFPSERFVIPAGLRHRFKAENRDSMIIEVSTFHRDEDVVRVILGD